ncbi:Excitatory amino acid transporter [Chlorella vulgaris]
MSSNGGSGSSSNGSRPSSSAAQRAPSPLKPRNPHADAPPPWQTSTLPPLRGRRRLAGSETQQQLRPDAQLDPQAALLAGSPDGGGGYGGGGIGGGDTRASSGSTVLDPESPLDSPREQRSERCCSGLMREPLLLFTLLGVVAGVLLGVALKPAKLGNEAIELIGFPGELMLRLLKMLVLPLVSASMVSGVCSLRQSGDGGSAAADGGGGGNGSDGGSQRIRRLARLTAAFYFLSTGLAILIGIALVVAVHPGKGAPFDAIASTAGGCHKTQAQQVAKQAAAGAAAAAEAAAARSSTAQALMHVALQVVPDNVVRAAVDMNVLGVITFSLMFGLALSSLGAPAQPLIKAVGVLNAAVQRMVMAALWVSPLGIGSLIAASILKACDLLGTLAALGLWVATVVSGLAIFTCLVLPLALWATTGRSPLAVARLFAQPLLMAFGTSTSAAALPLAMQCAKEAGCAEATVDFFLPLGTAVNMCGTALYEATTAIFIAQAHGVSLDAAQLLVVAVTASLAAVGAPAIPSAGLVTMLIVLQAVNLERYAADLAIILAVDWLLDRVRTAVNLLADVFGVVMVDHLMQRGVHSGGEGGKQIPYVQLELGDARGG